MQDVIFWGAGLLAIAAAVRVVFQDNPMTSVLHMIVTLVSLAILFLQLSAEFVAALQVIVYGGAIMVLFLFVIMLLNLRRDEFGPDKLPLLKTSGIVAALALMVVLVIATSSTVRITEVARLDPDLGSITSMGHALFGDYLLPFELTSILLVVAAVAAIVLGRRMKPAARTEDAAT